MASLESIFAFRNISKSIEVVKTGIPDRVPPAFFNLTEEVIGNETTYHTFYGERRLIRRGEYGALSLPYNLRPVGQKPVILTHFPGHYTIEHELLMRLRNVNDTGAQDRAREFIDRQGVNFRRRFDNNRLAHVVQLLNKGVLWYDAAGNLQQTSAGAVATVDTGVPAGNKGQAGGIIDGSWATDTTDIYSQFVALDKKATQQTGRPLKHCFYGQNLPGYIYKNKSLAQYFQFNPNYYQAMSNKPGVIPDGFMNKTWHPMYESFFEKEDGTVVQLWGGDDLTMTPDIDRDVYTLFEGSICVPTKIGVATGIADALANSEMRYGMTGYTVYGCDPVNVKVVMVDTVMPHWKTPLDLFLLDVTP